MLESTAKSADNRAPANAGLAAFEVAVAQQREFEKNLREAAERRKQAQAEAERRAADERQQAQRARHADQAVNVDASVVKAVQKIEHTDGNAANPQTPDSSSPSPARGDSVDIRV